MQKAKWLSGEALQIAVKRREAKSKGEKERYKHLNAEFPRIARRDKQNANEGSWERNHPKCQIISGLGNLESSNIRASGRRAVE